mmetsp:Transcript_72232/g.223173  ORF Transcript_72232/g.223173 Transcript_72232/m.223173 type:complete len:446 (-) Transcript_72232:46-1383(-)
MAKPAISLAFIGPQGSGKSTALGRLCQLRGGFSEEEGQACKGLAKDLGCTAGEYAWMLDRLRTERERGTTVGASVVHFDSESFSYTAVDTPGNAAFSKNLLAVTSMADVAVLVAPAAHGEWEAAVDSGRARELALCSFTMGIKNILVLVTKLDDVALEDPSARFEEVKKVASTFLKEVGYKQKDVPFVPVSGLHGDNLASRSAEMGWYSGKPVVEVLDEMGPINRPAEKPLRLPVLKVHESEEAGTVIVGRVETGTVRTGIKVILSPGGALGEVRSVHKDGERVNEARGGDIVGVSIGSGTKARDIRRGMVASSMSDPAAEAEHFLAQVVVLDHPGSIRNGYCPAIAVHTAQVPCEFEELLAKIDRKTGKECETAPAEARTGEVVTVRMRPCKPVCVEPFSAYPSLGRFAIRDHGRTVAVGVIKEVTKRAIPKSKPTGANEYFDS